MDALQRRTVRPSIHTLPTELITAIWFASVPSYDGKDVLMTPPFALGLGAVCRRWRAITLTTTWLWTDHVLTRMSQFRNLPVFLERSGNAPISFYILSGHCKWEDLFAGPPPPLQPWFHPAQRATWQPGPDLLVHHLHHTKSLQLRLLHINDLQLWLGLLKHASAPILEDLAFGLDMRFFGIEVDMSSLFSGHQLASLRAFETPIVPADWTAPIFRNIRRFLFWQRFRAMYPEVVASRSRALHRNINSADIILLLSTAAHLEELHICEGYLHPAPSTANIAAVKAAHLNELLITADCANPTAWSQLVENVPLPGIPRIAVRNVSASAAEYLLGHLEGDLSVNIRTERPMVPITTNIHDFPFDTWVKDGAYDLGLWHLTVRDSLGYFRDLTLNDDSLHRAQMLLNGCGRIMGSVRRLRVRACQWSQVSAALVQADMSNVEELVISFVVDLTLGYDNDEEMRHFWAHVDETMVNLTCIPPLHGSRLRLPSLSRLSLHAEHNYPEADRFLPMRLTSEALSSTLATLYRDTRLESMHLHNIIPHDDDADQTIRSSASLVTSSEKWKYTEERWWLGSIL
ncbi:hypothetical protein EXIGLDRAFT_664625 [Exidia glandulosa HHB12029]|uniref:F-box domain-containing protein n=1 Tax=Exidia glandulosa HHB12029 TaxID=1314781 RepID=A0A165Q377_EXIGL|nr:hypothetical protein EXIGLDRAFT_664625 [Exidia glandulosa HHB12029]